MAAACNDASLQPPAEAGGHWAETGDPTEAALLALAGKLGADRDTLDRDLPRVAEVAFDATRRRMTTLHQRPDGVWAAVKGAVDTLVPLLDPADVALGAEARAVAARWASDGYRILALADRQLPAVPDPPRTPRPAFACSAWWPWPTRRGPNRPPRSPPAAEPGSPR